MQDLNLQLLPCKGNTLPVELIEHLNIGDYWELNPDLRNHNPGHYHYAIVTVGRDGVEPSPSGFSDQCYRPRKLSSQIVPNRIELLLSAYQTDFLPLEDGTISGQGWTRTNDVSVVGDLQSLAFATRLPTQKYMK